MKHLKKLLVAFVALVAALVIATPAYAATITVEGRKEGESYDAYKIFDASINGDAVAYTIDSDATASAGVWAFLTNGLTADAKGVYTNSTYGLTFTPAASDPTVYVVNGDAMTEAKAADLAKALKTNITSIASAKVGTISDSTTSLTVDPGFYFVDSTTGSLCSLATEDTSQTIKEKNEDTEVEKEVEEITTAVGQTVHYTVTVHAKAGETVTLVDTLSTGLTLDAKPTTFDSTWNVSEWDTTPSASKFTIVFPEVAADTDFVVEYTATVNEDAIELNVVDNTATAKWGHNQETTPVKVETKLFKFDVKKVDGSDTTKTLDGVKFTLTKTEGNKTYYYDGKSVWTETKTELTTANGGMINVKGIAAGTYTLTETETLDGYNLLDAPVTITIAEDGSATWSGAASGSAAADASITIQVENNSGTVLPSTGGMGTTLFYIVGGLMVAGAAIALIAKNRVAKIEG